jgi:hypothetical protein
VGLTARPDVSSHPRPHMPPVRTPPRRCLSPPTGCGLPFAAVRLPDCAGQTVRTSLQRDF